jgi:hypothetical protein
MGAGDLGDAEECRRGLDHRDEAGRAWRHAALGFDLVDDLGEEPHMLGAVHFGQSQCQHPGADRRLDVAHRKPQWLVDADDNVSCAARDDLGRLRHKGARPLLFRGSDAVFEIEDDRVGAGHRDEQQ